MLKNNKGYSLIEVLIVITIMALLAGLSMLTFNSVNKQEPSKVMSNLVTNAKCAKEMVQAEEANYCIALFRANDGDYYVVYGTADGNHKSSSEADNQNALKSSFRSQFTVATNINGKDGKKNDSTQGLDLTTLLTKPSSAENYKNLGHKVNIYHDGTLVDTGLDSAVIIKFRKADGSALAGSGLYEFERIRGNEILCSTKLEATTGVFHDENVTTTTKAAATTQSGN